jgi:GT2 family glycosyltransferase
MIVVDNSSEDDSVTQIKAWAQAKADHGYTLVEYTQAAAEGGGEPGKEASLQAASPRNRMVLIANTTNSGPTGGANLGIQYALRRKPSADYVFLLDNDARVSPDTLTRLVDVSRREECSIVGGKILDLLSGSPQYPHRTTTMGRFFAPFVDDGLWTPPAGVTSWITCNANGGAMLLRRDVLLALNAARGCFLDSSLFSDGWEFEVCSFARKFGYVTMGTNEAFVWHKGDREYRHPLNPQRFYYSVRNRGLLSRAYLPAALRVVFHFIDLVHCALSVARCAVRRRPDIAMAEIRGIIDGYRGACKNKAFQN